MLRNPFDDDIEGPVSPVAGDSTPLRGRGEVNAARRGVGTPGSGSRMSVTNPFDGSVSMSMPSQSSAGKSRYLKKRQNLSAEGFAQMKIEKTSPSKLRAVNQSGSQSTSKGRSCFSLLSCCCSTKRQAWGLTVFTILVVLIAVCFVCVELYKHGEDPHILGWVSAGVFVIASVPIAVHEIVMHMVNFSNPDLQRYIIRIIWIVPIYGIESWFALRYDHYAVYMQAARELYEAYVIYSFVYYLLNFLGTDESAVVSVLRRKKTAVVRHVMPFCCLRPWAMGSEFLLGCKSGVLQYVLVKVATSLLTAFCMSHGIYGEGEFDLLKGYFYVVLLDNASQIWALYCLVLLYSGLREELAPLSPFLKFACVKSIVFFSWWQGFGIQMMSNAGFIPKEKSMTTGGAEYDVGRAIQNWLICAEMFFAAVAYKFAFSYTDFAGSTQGSLRFFTALIDSTSPFDFVHELGSFTKVPDWEVDVGEAYISDEESN